LDSAYVGKSLGGFEQANEVIRLVVTRSLHVHRYDNRKARADAERPLTGSEGMMVSSREATEEEVRQASYGMQLKNKALNFKCQGREVSSPRLLGQMLKSLPQWEGYDRRGLMKRKI
jgi:hypothetical protein